MPFHTMALTTYECRLKKYIYQPNTVTLNQMKSAFKNDELWTTALNNEDSTLFMFLDAYF